MVLICERFDLDEAVPEPNAPRATTPRKQWVLPRGFPFLIDDESGEIVVPVLLYLRDRYNTHSCYRDGAWKKQDSADAAVSDLKDWWSKLEARGVAWDAADDRLLAEWQIDMKTIPSGQTKDFLADATVARRCFSICSFYQWAFGRGLVPKALNASSSREVARTRMPGKTKHPHLVLDRSNSDADPHPISADNVHRLAEAMGPLPSEIATKWTPDPTIPDSQWRKSHNRKEQSSRDRLAYELGANCGPRIDEIINLSAETFEHFRCGETEMFQHFELQLRHTKGLRRREILIPYWLMSELADYVINERRVAIAEARRLWLGGGDPPWQLLLNGPGTGRHVGKPARADRIESRFNQACVKLGLFKNRIRARGTKSSDEVREVRHRFHDTRHTFAVTMFHALEKESGFHRPWIRLQKLLGHASVSTTISIYLKVLDRFGPETLEKLGRYFHAIRGLPDHEEADPDISSGEVY